LNGSGNGSGVALKEIVDMAALGRVKTLLDRYPLSAVKQAYDDFKQGHLIGRAVVIPRSSGRTRGVTGFCRVLRFRIETMKETG
jgi:hypothetical protein